LKDALPKIANVVPTPTPDVEILIFNERGAVLAVRSYCNTAHYWRVYFDTNKTIRETFGAAGHPIAEAHLNIGRQAARPVRSRLSQAKKQSALPQRTVAAPHYKMSPACAVPAVVLNLSSRGSPARAIRRFRVGNAHRPD